MVGGLASKPMLLHVPKGIDFPDDLQSKNIQAQTSTAGN